MWTSTLDLDPKRILLTRLLGRFWRGAYFSSYAPLRVENLPRPTLAASSWVRVRNRLAGICGSDLHLVEADGDLRISLAALPGHKRLYPGHEVVGEVVEIGDTVEHLRVGDRVVLQHGPNCISQGAEPVCRFCSEGFYNLCEYGNLPGPHAIGGGWSEEMVLPEQQLFRIPSWMSDEQAVLLEPTAVALHAVLRALPRPDSQALIIGAGTIGLLTLQILRALAPQVEISVLARHPFQIEQATRLGAHHIIYTHDSYLGVQTVTNARPYNGWFGNHALVGGFETIYDTIGTKRTLPHALRWACARANLVLVGVHLYPMHIDLTPIWNQEIKLIGSMSHGLEHWPPHSGQPRSTFDAATELIQAGQIEPEQFLTHRFAITDYQQALETAMGKGQTHAIKVAFDYSLVPSTVVPNVRASARSRYQPSITRQQEEQGPDTIEEETEKFSSPTPGEPKGAERGDQTARMPALGRKPKSHREASSSTNVPYIREQKSEPLLVAPSTSDLPANDAHVEPQPEGLLSVEYVNQPGPKEQKSEPLLATPSTSDLPIVSPPQKVSHEDQSRSYMMPQESIPPTSEAQEEEPLPVLSDIPDEPPMGAVESIPAASQPSEESSSAQAQEPVPFEEIHEETPDEPISNFEIEDDHMSELPPSTPEDMYEEHSLDTPTPLVKIAESVQESSTTPQPSETPARSEAQAQSRRARRRKKTNTNH
ncbi:alcohol dehydrogenase catalytic domain-containing protein [Ktedonospora formicarum]|uniref:Alcohol dehydrogenase n=1 Tax=Ktedonospora formicarum TaxID=2778364 RepID=A0A8J3MQL2_9CHLR|nr:alcohol dehydrogenase catalytic domain-containing protein [Ktedonospora formicarum]GHO44080.1 hypothetical protein KSX_22430 [Ktedonospora formicarum]